MKKTAYHRFTGLHTAEYTLFILFISLTFSGLAQQIEIPRISSMPDLPRPYEMRDWKAVALKYDSLVYDLNLTGDNLPLIFLVSETQNYPGHTSYGLDSYVGSFSEANGEAINILPSVIGASLCGADKLSQYEKNWVLMCEEYFNGANGEDVYLNNMNGSSGNDWWYETMPNVFFYQLNELYPHTGDFDRQFRLVADRWKAAVGAMGGSAAPWTVPVMNYRAWNLLEMEPLATGVKEPEASGALAWILYNAYHVTGDESYRVAAEWSMEYLNSLGSNPSYELQLAYGTYTAARMNAELGTGYDLDKMLNWCFDIGPLRNWGAILGNWGGYDCSGLIGEQADGRPGYAFIMNGFQQAAALMPLLKYDDRYANALGKWFLNLANSSRLFYSAYLPTEKQDNETWTALYDPESVIAYEALKETYNSQSPYATGDAMSGGWASTNLGLYGSSHVGMLGSLLDTTDVEAILRVDLCKTDFYGDKTFPVYLYYNPYETEKTISYHSQGASCSLYESTSNQFVATGVTGDISLTVPALTAFIVTEIPSDALIEKDGSRTLANTVVIDYNNGETMGNTAPRIKSMACADTLVLSGSVHRIYCTVQDQDETTGFKWSDSDEWTTESTFDWTAPTENAWYWITCSVKNAEGETDSDSIRIHVVDRITSAPEITGLVAGSRKLHPGQSTEIRCEATDLNNDRLVYTWSVSGGTFIQDDSTITWTSPEDEQIFTVSCTVKNLDDLEDSESTTLLVKDSTFTQEGMLVLGAGLNGNASDYSSFHNNGTASVIGWTTDRSDISAAAASFNGSSSKITFPNKDYLNFRDGISVLGWIYPEENVSGEEFILSHGSWQNRWKLSLTGNNILRFTVNCSSGITDLDSETSLVPGRWYHFAALYDGRDLELFIDGKPDSFKEWSGTINSTTYSLLAGQMLPDNASYNFKGILDDIRIYNYGIPDKLVLDGFNSLLRTGEEDVSVPFLVYPNPVSEHLYISFGESNTGYSVSLYDSNGKLCRDYGRVEITDIETRQLSVTGLNPGIYLLHIVEQDKTFSRKLLIF